MTELCEQTIHELNQRLRAMEVTSLDIVSSVAERIRAREKDVNGYITLLVDQALEQARKQPPPVPDSSPLYGIPVAIKDNICTEGVLTTCGSHILHNFISPYDAFVTKRIKAASGIIMGKTNMDEFAMGSSNETSYFGPVHNPYDLESVPGGSSGGSAAVVSYGGAIAALGSETSGSIRQPAAYCGVVGLKPTYGRVSRYGLVAHASSLDQIGVLARDVTDAAIMLAVIAGRDPQDSTSVDVQVGPYLPLDRIDEIRIGVPRECFIEGLDPRISTMIRGLLRDIAPMCAGVKDVSLPHSPAAVATYFLICMAEASSNLARYDSVRYGLRALNCASLEDQYEQTREAGFNDEVKRRILLGTYGLSKGSYEEYYGTGQKVRTLVCRDFEQVFQDVDVIVTPTSPTTAFKIGEKTNDPLAMYLEDVYTTPAALAGLPAISVPCPERVDGLPVGLQVVGRPFEEKTVLQVAREFERLSD
jgi:aspartyl-tRNA(Asn)/glutamyl-tRNA(Gln) amidotransferase subunit A